MWRRENDSINGRIGQDCFIAISHPNMMFCCKLLGFSWRARRSGNKLNVLTQTLYAFYKILSPSTHADDCCVDHLFFLQHMECYCQKKRIGDNKE